MKNILITGCSTGIGAYSAYALKNDGHRVFVTARDDKSLEQLKADGFEAFYLEMADSKAIKKCIDSVMDACDGQLDVLFNNIGYGQPGFVEDLSRDILKEQFDINVFGTVELTNLVLKQMRKNGHGRIAQNSSVLGFISMKYRGAYNASKYALEGITDTLRLELRDTDIKIALIEPGPIESDFRANSLKAFLKNINYKNSIHVKDYEKLLKSLQDPNGKIPFKLGPDAVYDSLKHFITSKRPKLRYRVTKATSILWYLKRVLSTRLLDAICSKY
ncbi:MAG: Putative NAD(P)-dependent oxidoreductase EC-YbbO [uncultured Campylobacterales bacterium]|uniref:NAD(P)-dependent oxidoreductase EC-YbbO n=1 Tax=uncultured Campylobacterales bacterium TaxID=352960 RepID=A0A6S6SEV9_9BACT|nr:MAG: Putative NAD(P)-dependent oxidoreductase EC-YbbO [uncultured Campylobacterales bacterium]